jgi:peptide/nickel transport system permease protein
MSQNATAVSTGNAQQTLAANAPSGRVSKRASTWTRFRQHKLALIGVFILFTLVVLAVGSPWIAQNDPYRTNLRFIGEPPSREFWLGTDASGRDVFARVTLAGRVSLQVGLVAVSIYTTIGVIVGALAGYYGGFVDSTLMRLADIFLAFPSLIIIITLVSVLGPSMWNIMAVIGLLGWPPIARIVRGQFLSLREQEFVLASKTVGARGRRVMFRHLLPNALAPVIVAATFGMASAILLEAGLSFLGLGVQPPTPTWGNMLTDAQSLTILQNMLWLWIPPGVLIALAVLSINFIGDGLRDALDPHHTR